MSAWLSGTSPLTGLPTATEADRAALALRRIADKPSSIAFRTPAGVTLAAQTVRLEMSDRASVVTSDAGSAPRADLIIFGIKGHPLRASTCPDTDIKAGYTFNLGNAAYRITDTILTIGEIQGICVKI